MREKLIKSPLKRAFVLFSIISLLTYLLSPIIIVSDAFLVKTTFVSALCKVKSSKQNIEEEGSQSPALTPLIQTQIREAIALSTKSSRDINAAYQAANTLWPSILYKEDKKTTTLGPKIELLCRALYATTLTQIGRDKDADIILIESKIHK